ncbi:hypothetical protein F511_09626 [Dorcoceras hygrometricum]|uniref:Uncharacterized protein n=1 Tax=Dorcoceras hygrometricum TaxID=472368 RepID=A0A2Z7DA78_9LAMI|nr:hypothetical protein F511_09626 [Dorcoceras hygrometricum]
MFAALIPDEMMLPSTIAAEPTRIQFGLGIEIKGVQEGDWCKDSLPQIDVADKGKAHLVEPDTVKGHPAREMFTLICADIEFLQMKRSKMMRRRVGESADVLALMTSSVTSSYPADVLRDQSQDSAAIAKRCRLHKLIRQRFAHAIKIQQEDFALIFQQKNQSQRKEFQTQCFDQQDAIARYSVQSQEIQAQRIEEVAKLSSRSDDSAVKQLTTYQSGMSTAEVISNEESDKKPAKEKDTTSIYFSTHTRISINQHPRISADSLASHKPTGRISTEAIYSRQRPLKKCSAESSQIISLRAGTEMNRAGKQAQYKPARRLAGKETISHKTSSGELNGEQTGKLVKDKPS